MHWNNALRLCYHLILRWCFSARSPFLYLPYTCGKTTPIQRQCFSQNAIAQHLLGSPMKPIISRNLFLSHVEIKIYLLEDHTFTDKNDGRFSTLGYLRTRLTYVHRGLIPNFNIDIVLRISNELSFHMDHYRGRKILEISSASWYIYSKTCFSLNKISGCHDLGVDPILS